jgi:cobaltochelatase CobN
MAGIGRPRPLKRMNKTRTRILRMDGKLVYLAQKRAHLFVCAKGCCCGRTDRGHAAVPVDFYKQQYKQRKLRQAMQLSMNGCLGPCAMANAVLLVFDGRPIWFQSINHEPQIVALFDYVGQMLAVDSYLPPPAQLAEYVFDYYLWSNSLSQPAANLPCPLPVGEQSGILLLTHADTDLLCLRNSLSDLPAGLGPIRAASLSKIQSEEHMQALVAGEARSARMVIVRLLGGATSLPGFRHLVEAARRQNQLLLVVSGAGAPDPELTAASTAPPAIVHETTAYLQLGGRDNFAHCLRFLSDHLLLTGFGYEPPRDMRQHGVYHPDLGAAATLADWLAGHNPNLPTVGLLFYRAHWMSGNLAFIDAFVRQIESQGANALPVFTSSLKETVPPPARFAELGRWPAAFDFFFSADAPIIDSLIMTMSFSMGEINAGGTTSAGWGVETLVALDLPVLQAITCSTTCWQWQASARGLNPLDTAMQVALPEFDGRIITVPISFKERPPQRNLNLDQSNGATPIAGESIGGGMSGDGELIHYAPLDDRVSRVVGLALRLAVLRKKPNRRKRIAFILTNSPGKAARVGNAVGLDTPASLMHVFAAMRQAGYQINDLPDDGDALIQALIDRCSYDQTFLSDEQLAGAAARVPAAEYASWFGELPQSARQRMIAQWGDPPGEAYVHEGAIALAGLDLGNVFLALQPPRGYGLDPGAIYHQPDLPPTHNYYALYRWLRDSWRADAIVHMGKHGTLEWLPGKGLGLSADCFPDSFLDDLPLIYPFIINNPGEGAQAKRRTHAVVVDHLIPPMTTADAYGELAELMQLVDEYYQVEMLDPQKLPLLQQQIWDLIKQAHLDEDLKHLLRQDHGDHVHDWDETMTPEGTPIGLASMQGRDVAHLVEDLDGYLCELAGAQIRDGLHVLGQQPQGEQLVGLLEALTRVPNLEVPSLRDGVARRFGLESSALLAGRGQRMPSVPDELLRLADRPLVTCGDALEVVDELGRHVLALLADRQFDPDSISLAIAETFGPPAEQGGQSNLDETLDFVCRRLVPTLRQTGDEITNLLRGLEGRYVPAGPSGAPTRGMAHVLPTGRNFYAVDPRALPSQAAWLVGQELAREVIERFVAETKNFPETIGINVWGTSSMRTQGDDVAQIFALLGVRPVWQRESRRLIGVELIPLPELGRPRVDVVVRISGFFRDAFPHLVRLLNEAVDLAMAADEPPDKNFVRKHYLEEVAARLDEGLSDCEVDAERCARLRVFGSKPGTYGAGILPLIEEGNWRDQADLAEAYVNWGGYAYTGAGDEDGIDARDVFRQRLSGVDVAVHNQDNREHDIFDSDDYLQFHGGMIATIRALSGRKPRHYFGDTHDPSRPVVRDLKEEALRVFRTRVVNPKWLEGIARHGYKGGLELTATVDYLFGYDATAGVVDDWMYEQVAQTYALSRELQEFLQRSNPWALHAISQRLLEAAERGLWAEPRPETLAALRDTLLASEAMLEQRVESSASWG